MGVYQGSKDYSNEFAQLDESTSEDLDEGNSDDKTKPDNNNKPPSSVENNNVNDEVETGTDDINGSNDEPTTDESLLEFDTYEGPDYVQEANSETDQQVEAEEVMSPTTLHFNHETDDILWPVSGNVIRKYSMDSLVSYETLAQWKVSPAMLISATEGEEVTCATDGIVIAIEENEETGITVTSSIGDGYALVYGQLESLVIKEGDSIEKGQIIGNISKPTRYNLVEGPSLYLQLLKGEETLDPMLCLE